MTTQAPIAPSPTVAPQPEEGIYSLHEEVIAQIALMKKKPAASAQEVYYLIMREIMPLIKDLSYYVRENRMDIDELQDEQDGVQNTQFLPEDAVKFGEVIQFAQFQAQAILQSDAASPEAKEMAQKIATQAEECLKTIEESTVEEEGEDEETEGETDG